jgi:trehalose utilization protein
MNQSPRVTVWNEFRHEKTNTKVAEIYPNGIHGAIVQCLTAESFPVRMATLDEPEHGLSDAVLEQTKRLLGTSCNLRWRHVGEKERLWVVEPGHPIAAGLGEWIDIPTEEMYGEPFDIPAPDALVLISWFQGGEVFRGGCCYQRGLGKIFYFRPGDENYPTYHHPDVRRMIVNAVRWAAPGEAPKVNYGERSQPLECF